VGIASKEAIVNLAYRKLGQKTITDITASDVGAERANDVYNPLRLQLLEEVKPRFATTPVILGHVVDSAIIVTGIAVSSTGLITITATAHNLITGDGAGIAGIGGMVELNGRVFDVTVLTANTLTLDNEDGTSHTAFTSGGTIGKLTTVPGETQYKYMFALPSNFVEIKSVNGVEVKQPDDRDYDVMTVGGVLRLLTEQASVHIRYVFDESDTTRFSNYFINVLAWLIASELAYTITQSKTKEDKMREMYENELTKLKGLESQGAGTPRRPQQDDILTARM